MKNHCTFSPCRRYRYTLRHEWAGLFDQSVREIAWIGLNPSTADESDLDPTLRRIRGFSDAAGFRCFTMLNLFGWRDTDPAGMKAAADPVGPGNDDAIRSVCSSAELVVACWGAHGTHRGRDRVVVEIVRSIGTPLVCLSRNRDGTPGHPLYLTAKKTFCPFEP